MSLTSTAALVGSSRVVAFKTRNTVSFPEDLRLFAIETVRAKQNTSKTESCETINQHIRAGHPSLRLHCCQLDLASFTVSAIKLSIFPPVAEAICAILKVANSISNPVLRMLFTSRSVSAFVCVFSYCIAIPTISGFAFVSSKSARHTVSHGAVSQIWCVTCTIIADMRLALPVLITIHTSISVVRCIWIKNGIVQPNVCTHVLVSRNPQVPALRSAFASIRCGEDSCDKKKHHD